MVVSTTELIASALKKSISVAEMIYSEDVHVSIASCKNVIRGWQRAGVHRWKDALNEFAVLWEDRVQSATRSTDGIDKLPKSSTSIEPHDRWWKRLSLNVFPRT